MLKVASYDIVFTELPGEVTLALNISGCPNRCAGCHSPHLQEDTGEPLDDGLLDGLIERYGDGATCVCFMGGDADPREVARLAARVRSHGLKAAWYSGRDTLPDQVSTADLDYLKLGPYIESRGGLRSAGTNQRLYRIVDGEPEDITTMFLLH